MPDRPNLIATVIGYAGIAAAVVYFLCVAMQGREVFP